MRGFLHILGGILVLTACNPDLVTSISQKGPSEENPSAEFNAHLGFRGIGGIDTITSGSVRVFWTAIPGANQYEVLKVLGTTAESLATLGPDKTEYTATGLNAEEEYAFRVYAIDSEGKRDGNTKDLYVKTTGATPIVSQFNSISYSGLDSIDQVAGSSVRLNWSTHSEAVGFAVYKVELSSVSLIAVVSGDQTSYRVKNLQYLTGYKFRVRLMDDEGKTDQNTNDLSVTTLDMNSEFINFNSYPLQSLGGTAQDVTGTVAIEDGGFTLHMIGNRWKLIAFPFNVQATTVLEFDFKSSVQGEIHGIGFYNNADLNESRFFKLYGTQTYGIATYFNYAASAPNLKHYTVAVGQAFTGSTVNLGFTTDQDITNPNAESYFSNVRVYTP